MSVSVAFLRVNNSAMIAVKPFKTNMEVDVVLHIAKLSERFGAVFAA